MRNAKPDRSKTLCLQQHEFNRALAPLRAKHGRENVQRMAESYGWGLAEPKDTGRPAVYDYQMLRDLWLFVKVGTGSTALSVAAFCKKHEFPLTTSGAPEDQSWIRGETLRRRFHEVERLMREDAFLDRRLHQDLADLLALLSMSDEPLDSPSGYSGLAQSGLFFDLSARARSITDRLLVLP